MKKNWKNIDYLLSGNQKQRSVHKILTEMKILEVLKKYNPIVVGTIPISIDIDKSDIDIACEVYNFNEFEKLVINSFSHFENLKMRKRKEDEKEILVVNFFIEKFEVEIYGENTSVENQNGYRHMVIEDILLKIGGSKLKEEIIHLKKQGVKTEPAFAKYLNLSGNPYDELLNLENKNEDYLKQLININIQKREC